MWGFCTLRIEKNIQLGNTTNSWQFWRDRAGTHFTPGKLNIGAIVLDTEMADIFATQLWSPHCQGRNLWWREQSRLQFARKIGLFFIEWGWIHFTDFIHTYSNIFRLSTIGKRETEWKEADCILQSIFLFPCK